MGSRPLGPKVIDGLLVPPGKAYNTLLTDHLRSEPVQVKWFKSDHPYYYYTYGPFWLTWVVIFETQFGCYGVLILSKSSIKWKQRPDMIIAVFCGIKHQFKQTIGRMPFGFLKEIGMCIRFR